jgi:hypothetical protein
MNRRGILTASLIALLLATFVFWVALTRESATAAPGSGTLHGTDAARGNLLRIDTTTGFGTVVGPMTLPDVQPPGFPSLAIHPTNGRMYAGEGRGNPLIYEVNPATAAITLVGDTGLGFASVAGLDFRADGTLFASVNIAGAAGTGADHLAIIDETNAATTIIGPFGSCNGVVLPADGSGSCTLEGMEGIAFDAMGTLWGVLSARGAAGAPGLYTIDTTSGAATFFSPIVSSTGGQLSGGVVSIQFDCDGTLYGGSARAQGGAGDGGRLITIDPLTGVGVFVGPVPATSGSSLGALAFSDNCGFVPQEPRSAGFWGHQCSDLGYTQVTPEELDAFFADIEGKSAAFTECADVGCYVVNPAPPRSQMREKAERQAISLWLNVVSGRLPLGTIVDLAPLSSASSVGEAIMEVEGTLCDAGAKKPELELAKDIAESLNLGGVDMELVNLSPTLLVSPGQSVTPSFAVINMSPLPWSYTVQASGTWASTPGTQQIDNLASGAMALLGTRINVPAGAAPGATELIEIVVSDTNQESQLQRQTTVSLFVRSSSGGDQKVPLQVRDQ